ncbi:hypothetical protein FRC96_21205 [Lujinxingia vulgaris]|uniref:Uncharacterized protein n=1 Tax=Lujinxingia vulgaris TaxID=2600176 RepID=A0A5C6X306_9DELT|nr:hypothetical protein [Lujinxingia vulgaris]TXD31380.1 hypothetical protein FRC96_21205 [Lujinxingia vulgaris]
MPKHRLLISYAFVILAITVVSVGGSQEAGAMEPPYCPFDILGGTTLGEGVMADEGEPLTLYVHGYPDELWQADPENYPDTLIATHATGERTVSLSRISALPLDNQEGIATYGADEGLLDTGRWDLSYEDEPVGQFNAYPPPIDRLVLPFSTPQAYVQDSESARDYLDRNQRARATLQVILPVPGEWKAWHADLHDGALVAVRLGVDAPPSTSVDYTTNTGFTLTSSGEIEVFSPELSCWPGRNANWIDGGTLHGLIWPVGTDPEAVSVRFELDLAELQRDFDAIYGDDFADTGGGGNDAGNREDDASESINRPTGQSRGCGSTGNATPEHLALSLLMLLGTMCVVKRRSTSK